MEEEEEGRREGGGGTSTKCRSLYISRQVITHDERVRELPYIECEVKVRDLKGREMKS